MKQPTTKLINATLAEIEAAELPLTHPRAVARQAVARYRRGSAIRRDYDFSAAPLPARQVIYDMSVRYSRRAWWSRLLR